MESMKAKKMYDCIYGFMNFALKKVYWNKYDQKSDNIWRVKSNSSFPVKWNKVDLIGILITQYKAGQEKEKTNRHSSLVKEVSKPGVLSEGQV